MIDFSSARIALDTLFAVPDSRGGLSLPEGRFFVLLSGLLDRASGISANVCRPAGCADYLNALDIEFGTDSVSKILLEECFEAVIRHKVLPGQLAQPDETACFLLNAVLDLCTALKHIADFPDEETRKRLLPSAGKIFELLPDRKSTRLNSSHAT